MIRPRSRRLLSPTFPTGTYISAAVAKAMPEAQAAATTVDMLRLLFKGVTRTVPLTINYFNPD